jgi:hypothetical protein
VEITAPGRTLSPGEWKDVLHGLRQHLPDVAELIQGNRGGEGGGLDPAHEKLIRLPQRETPDKPHVPSPGEIVDHRNGPDSAGPAHGQARRRGR